MKFALETIILGLFCFNLDYTFSNENNNYYKMENAIPRLVFCLILCSIPIVKVIYTWLCILGSIVCIFERIKKKG